MAELALVLQLVAAFLFAFSRDGSRIRFATAGRVAAATVGLLLVALLLFRSIRISFPALTGTYEGLLLLAAAMDGAVVVGYRRLFRERGTLLAAVTFAGFVYLAILTSPIVPSELYPPVPVLRSYWLVLHVAFAFLGLAFFTAAAVASLVAFFVSDPGGVDAGRDRAVVLGFVFYAVGGLVFGAIWAESAWGRFWGWDPKETWALITTLFYTGYLHLRYVRSVSQRTARLIVIAAWILSIFTFWGVNFLMSGLHAYA